MFCSKRKKEEGKSFITVSWGGEEKGKAALERPHLRPLSTLFLSLSLTFSLTAGGRRFPSSSSCSRARRAAAGLPPAVSSLFLRCSSSAVTFFFEASAAAAAPVEIVSPSTATEAKRAASSSLSDDEDDEEAGMRSMRLKRPLVEGVRPACAALWARFRQFEFECENTFANCERKKIQKSSQTLFSLFSVLSSSHDDGRGRARARFSEASSRRRSRCLCSCRRCPRGQGGSVRRAFF